MRYAVISDIHGNLDALDAVLALARELKAEHVVCLGDVVGYGPEPSQCLERIREADSTVIAGNHDFAVVDKIDISNFNVYAREATLWTRENLDESALSFLSALPLLAQLDGFTVVHGSLHSPELFDYVQTSYDAHLSMQRMEGPLCFIGHSHVPITFLQDELVSYSLARRIDVNPASKTVVNVGSVGQPRDFDPRAAFAIYDSDACQVSLHRAAYDVEAVARKIRRAGLPKPLGERLSVGR